MELVPFVVAILALVGLDFAALRWGVSTRRGEGDHRDRRADWW